MAPFDKPSVARGAAIAGAMAFRGLKRNSLTPSGAVAGWAVGFLSFCCGGRGLLLLLFYVVGTKATKYKIHVKSKLDQSASESSCRSPGQVLACSALGVTIQLAHAYCYGEERAINFAESSGPSSLACALVAHHATSLADTLASELGVLHGGRPVLITSGRGVPRGTNGGVTLAGTAYGVLGGAVIGTGAVILDYLGGFGVRPLAYIAFAISCGTLGNLADSILGATVQVTYYDPEKKMVCDGEDDAPDLVRISGRDILTNAQVNVVSICIASAMGTALGPYFFD